jgi:hypothetical protein
LSRFARARHLALPRKLRKDLVGFLFRSLALDGLCGVT